MTSPAKSLTVESLLVSGEQESAAPTAPQNSATPEGNGVSRDEEEEKTGELSEEPTIVESLLVSGEQESVAPTASQDSATPEGNGVFYDEEPVILPVSEESKYANESVPLTLESEEEEDPFCLTIENVEENSPAAPKAVPPAPGLLRKTVNKALSSLWTHQAPSQAAAEVASNA